MIWIVIFLALIFAYLLSLQGRRGHKGLHQAKKFAYAHRGLHGGALPENSMAAFEKALLLGYGIELDVHLLADGSLAVFHDYDLKRMTGRDGLIEDLTAQDLKGFFLAGTDQTIPLLSQVLSLVQNKAPLLVELKTAGDNYARLTEATCNLLDQYNASYCIESFDGRCLLWLKKNRPDVLRGQLSQNVMREKDLHVPLYQSLLIYFLLTSFITKPDFIAYRYRDRRNISCVLSRKLWGIHGFSWTITDPDTCQKVIAQGWTPIFEAFEP